MKTYTPPKLSFALMSLLIGFPILSETIYTPSLPSIVEGLATNAHLVEWTLSIYFIGFALGVGFWGILADKIGRKPVMLIGLFIYILGTLGCLLSPNIGMLLFCRFIQALGASVGSVITQTILRDVLSGKERSRWFSLMGIPLALAPALGPFIGGLLDYFFDWRVNFLALLILGMGLWITTKRNLPETLLIQNNTQSVKILSLLKTLCLDKKVMGCAVIVGIINGMLFSFYAQAPFILMESMGLSATQYGLVGLSIAFAGIMGSTLSHRLLRHYSHEHIMSLGSFLTLIGSFLMVLCAYAGFFSDKHLWLGTSMLLGTMFITMFGAMGLMIPNLLSIALSEYQAVAGRAGSLFGCIYYLIVAILTAIMGKLHNGTALPMPCYFMFLSIVLLIIYRITVLYPNQIGSPAVK